MINGTNSRVALVHALPPGDYATEHECLALQIEEDYFLLESPIESGALIGIIDQLDVIKASIEASLSGDRFSSSDGLRLGSIGVTPRRLESGATGFFYELSFQVSGREFTGVDVVLRTTDIQFETTHISLLY